jgi:glycosyltransferase involved in cell wall biosynthesis
MPETLNISTKSRDNLNKVDEIWVPSLQGKEIFEANGIVGSKIHVIHEPLDCSIYQHDHSPLPLDNDGFRFASVFKWEPRKGYDILLKAYFQEFKKSEKVVLYIKTHLMYEDSPRDKYSLDMIMTNIDKIAAELNIPKRELPDIHVLTGSLRSDHIVRLYKSVDAYVQPSRGEGWGLTIIQAMAMGLPTISTSWGGQTEYMNKNNSFAIPIDGYAHAYGPCCFESWQMWAEPSISETRKLMRHVFENREEAKEVGRQARHDVFSRYCRSTVISQVNERLKAIAGML